MNNHKNNRVTLRVWGDFACFTRPEMKVERVSYPVITPSAARGILEAVFWEPEMYYLIDTVRVIKRGAWFSTRRNEVTAVISFDNAKQWMKAPEKVMPIQAGGGAADGTQRNMLGLREVEYLITAEIRLSKLADPSRCNLAKYQSQFQRRAVSGKCFYRPSLGVREFDAYFDYEADAKAAFTRRQQELGEDFSLIKYEPLGLMLYDVFDWCLFEKGFKWLSTEELAAMREKFEQSLSKLQKSEQKKRLDEYDAKPVLFAGHKIMPYPSFFQAEIRDSVLRCHPDDVEIISQPTEGK
ncbi:MAG: type I-C CRISPR-associated protein Cas5c [Planctomycetaceae bacterium]|nr:type I-C CRISPR-associated protein Cas5c [Planctomycetaceae bacterium]